MPDLIIKVHCQDRSDLDWLQDLCVTAVEAEIDTARDEKRLGDEVHVSWTHCDGFTQADEEWRSVNQHPTVSEPISEPHLSQEHAREWIELDDILGEAWVECRLVGAWERVGQSRLVVPGHNGPDRRVVRHRRSEANALRSEIKLNRRRGPGRRRDD
jgi:hypothetical protein